MENNSKEAAEKLKESMEEMVKTLIKEAANQVEISHIDPELGSLLGKMTALSNNLILNITNYMTVAAAENLVLLERTEKMESELKTMKSDLFHIDSNLVRLRNEKESKSKKD